MSDVNPSHLSEILQEKNYSPLKISFRGWKLIVVNTVKTLIQGPSMLVAAGCAFFTTLSLFPTISSLISMYGLVFDPQTVEPQLNFLQHFLPPSVYKFLQQMIHTIIDQTESTLTIQLAISIVLALWASAVGTKALITGLNVVYNRKEERNFFKFQLLALALTFCAILGTSLTLATIVAIPAIIKLLPLNVFYEIMNYFPNLDEYLPAINMARTISNIVVLVFVIWTFSLIYRFGPCRALVLWRWILPGAILSTILWLLAAFGFSFYVAHLANFTSTYGPLGTIAAVMMWFWVSCYVVLLGAQFNSKIEEHIIEKSPTL
ncbi:YihY/virulence factor BrkB family protein [Commensalibacter nepenthis]|uniref:YihY/virulence factor BrkB family protein n=1 Tax=Commensalibacter nepenthis TaxID=3043872 RepID=A0ABT6Q7E9_9PROT|nr:YihY/virulence factor BrkB family protein [Commensalibacter sp. TBRC 10068]MDI2112810.1 YihY/virulence factor BrkB family protein [Commensalibacter sp. TBRC 10068]